jgi:sigma-B regulation protein RsbU (phosphoserine phosphatase)
MTSAEAMRRAWWWLTRTFVGRLLLLALGVKALVWAGREVGQRGALLGAVNTMASLLLLIAVAVLGYRTYVHVKRVVLWRVRRKLMLSYVFIGFVPALLLMIFFSLSGVLLFYNVGAYMLRAQVATFVDRAQALAQTAAADLAHVQGASETAAALAKHQQRANAAIPLVSYAVVPSSAACAAGTRFAAAGPVAVAGPWGQSAAPTVVPEWISCAGYVGLVVGGSSPGDATAAPNDPGAATKTPRAWVSARAVAWVDRPGGREAVIVDVPIGDALLNKIATDLGVAVQSVRLFDFRSRAFDADTPAPADGGAQPERGLILGPANISLDTNALSLTSLKWATILDSLSWETGVASSLVLQFGLGLRAVYERLVPVDRLGDISLAQVLLATVAVVAVLFLIILAVAFLMGFVLARSITGAVHELFEGTERVRSGDFSHKIVVRSRDQLGELAESFNSMTASIEDLLVQKAQKERLQQ